MKIEHLKKEQRKCVECQEPLFGQKQKYCSNKCKQKHHYHKVKQQTNTYHSQTLRAIRRKLKLIELLGGQCCKCGYAVNVSALHFHHRNSYEKEVKLDMRVLSNRRWEVIWKEAQKCDLLCANCHAEAHNPELSMENVRRIANGASRRKRRDEQGVNSGKP